MVDNVAITPGTGATVAADDIGGVLHQRVKVVWGPDGTVNDADVASGKPMPVQLRASGGTELDLATQTTAAAILAKLTADPATQTTLAAILAKIIAAPATEAKQDTLIAIDFATETTLAALSATISEVAHDAADSGNPSKIGGKAIAGLNSATLVAAADRTNAYFTLDGALATSPRCTLEDIVSGVASNTDGASTEVIPTAGAGIKQYLTKVILANMHASSTIYVEMKSGTTVKARIPCPPGGAVVSFDPPLPPNAANEAWNFDPSAATTTIYCTAVGFKSKV